MADGVKSTRTYSSPRRQEQAAATRLRILEAAHRLFGRDGYPATTMSAVAVEAGVSLKTVYLVVETKPRLLRAVWDYLLKGDQEEAGVAARPWYVEVVEEPDPVRTLRLLARGSVAVKVRIGGILHVIRTAAPMDADTAALWQLIQTDFHDNQGVIVRSLAATGSLRTGLDVARATDILWTLNHPDVWLLLSGERKWSPAEFEAWLFRTACEQLLGVEPPEDPDSAPFPTSHQVGAR